MNFELGESSPLHSKFPVLFFSSLVWSHVKSLDSGRVREQDPCSVTLLGPSGSLSPRALASLNSPPSPSLSRPVPSYVGNKVACRMPIACLHAYKLFTVRSTCCTAKGLVRLDGLDHLLGILIIESLFSTNPDKLIRVLRALVNCHTS